MNCHLDMCTGLQACEISVYGSPLRFFPQGTIQEEKPLPLPCV